VKLNSERPTITQTKTQVSVCLTFQGGEDNYNKTTGNVSPSRSIHRSTENNRILHTVENKLHQMKLKYGEDVIDPERSPKRLQEKAKIKQSLERSRSLYEKAVIQYEVQKTVTQKMNEIKDTKEKKECTFKPKVNWSKYINNSNDGKQINNRRVYDRQFGLMLAKREKIEHIAKENTRQETDFPFHPKINPNNSSLFHVKNNVIHDFYTRNYMVRLEKARREKFIKLSKLNNPGSCSTSSLRRFNRSASSDSTAFSHKHLNKSQFTQTLRHLHDDLLNLSINIG